MNHILKLVWREAERDSTLGGEGEVAAVALVAPCWGRGLRGAGLNPQRADAGKIPGPVGQSRHWLAEVRPILSEYVPPSGQEITFSS